VNNGQLTPEERAEEKRLYGAFRDAGLSDYAACVMTGTISALRRIS